MRSMKYAAAAILVAAAACSATGDVETPNDEPDAGPGGEPVVAEAGPITDASSDDETPLDAARALVCGDAGFCETQLPKSDIGLPLSLRSVWAVDATQVWSVTAEGYILRYDGATWTIDHRAKHELYAVWATSTDVWAGGEGGLLLHRSAAGAWDRVETNHVAPIRAIYGTSASDIWLSRDDASIDHFDGARLDNHPVDVPGLRISVLFGSPELGVYAAGYVRGPTLSSGLRDDRARVFAVSTAGISPFNAALPLLTGFAPISGGVQDSADAGPKVFLLGIQTYTSGLYLRSSSFTESSTAPATLLTPSPAPDEIGHPIPVLVLNADETWVTRAMGLIQRWNGKSYTPMSLAMGYDVSPAPVFGAHRTSSDIWLVGDGFALRGPKP
jgi:hypothetical protein